MPFMTRIPSDLARFGLKVELVPGWETRGSSSFAPACVVDHWTAGPRGTTKRPSLNVVTYGRSDLPGPLCNIYLARDGTCVVVAAGRANHAGAGGWRGLVGNSAAYGIEAESAGDGDWTPAMLDAYPRLNAALLSGLRRDASWLCGHHEWAPGRKIDIRDVMARVRADTARHLAGGAKPPTPPPAPVPEDDMTPDQAKKLDTLAQQTAYIVGQLQGQETDSKGNKGWLAADGRAYTLVDLNRAAFRATLKALDVSALAAEIVAKLPASSGGGASKADVKAALREFFADAAAT